MVVQPYLFFEGRCDEALAFYQRTLGATLVMLMRYRQMPGKHDPKMGLPPPPDKVMYASLRIGETTVFVSDGHCHGATRFSGFGLSLSAADVPEAEKWFAALSDGGAVTMPISKTFFSPAFGMVTDLFGITWMVMAASSG